jgi:hypothetical protein
MNNHKKSTLRGGFFMMLFTFPSERVIMVVLEIGAIHFSVRGFGRAFLYFGGRK